MGVIHQKTVTDMQALLDKKTEETTKLEGENNNLRNEIKTGNGAGNNIEAILNERLDKIGNSIDQIITKKLENSIKVSPRRLTMPSPPTIKRLPKPWAETLPTL